MIDYSARLSAAILGMSVALVQMQPAQALTKVEVNEQGEWIGIHGRSERAERLQNSQGRNNIAALKTEFNYAILSNAFLSLAPQVNKTIALRISSPSVSSAPKADDFLLQAEDKYKKGDYRGAIADYDQAIQLDRKNASAYVNRGVARHELGDKKGAIADYDKAIQLNPKNALDYYNRGNIRHELGDKEGAIFDYDKAIQINSKDALAYYKRGVARYELEDKKGTIADLQKAAALFKSQSDEKNHRYVLESLQQINGR